MHLVISSYIFAGQMCVHLFSTDISLFAGYFWKAMFGEYLTK